MVNAGPVSFITDGGRITQRIITPLERQVLTQRFGLGRGVSRVGAGRPSAAQDFFSGRSTAPFQGSIRDPVTGWTGTVSSKKGQRLLAEHNARVAAASSGFRGGTLAAGLTSPEKPLPSILELAIAKTPPPVKFKAPTIAEGTSLQNKAVILQKKAKIENLISGGRGASFTTQRQIREVAAKTDLYNRRVQAFTAQEGLDRVSFIDQASIKTSAPPQRFVTIAGKQIPVHPSQIVSDFGEPRFTPLSTFDIRATETFEIPEARVEAARQQQLAIGLGTLAAGSFGIGAAALAPAAAASPFFIPGVAGSFIGAEVGGPIAQAAAEPFISQFQPGVVTRFTPTERPPTFDLPISMIPTREQLARFNIIPQKFTRPETLAELESRKAGTRLGVGIAGSLIGAGIGSAAVVGVQRALASNVKVVITSSTKTGAVGSQSFISVNGRVTQAKIVVPKGAIVLKNGKPVTVTAKGITFKPGDIAGVPGIPSRAAPARLPSPSGFSKTGSGLLAPRVRGLPRILGRVRDIFPRIGERGAIGGGVRVKKPKIPELGGFLKPVKKGFPEPLTVRPKGKGVLVPELGKFLEPRKVLQFEEKEFLKTLGKIGVVKRVVKKLPKQTAFGEPLKVKPKFDVPELGKFLEVRKPLTFVEKGFVKSLKRPASGEKPKVFEFGKPTKGIREQTIVLQRRKSATTLNDIFRVKPSVTKDVSTTAGLSKITPLSFRRFRAEVEAVARPKIRPIQPQRFVPGSLSDLSRGLPRVSKTPVELLFEREQAGLFGLEEIKKVKPRKITGFEKITEDARLAAERGLPQFIGTREQAMRIGKEFGGAREQALGVRPEFAKLAKSQLEMSPNLRHALGLDKVKTSQQLKNILRTGKTQLGRQRQRVIPLILTRQVQPQALRITPRLRAGQRINLAQAAIITTRQANTLQQVLGTSVRTIQAQRIAQAEVVKQIEIQKIRPIQQQTIKTILRTVTKVKTRPSVKEIPKKIPEETILKKLFILKIPPTKIIIKKTQKIGQGFQVLVRTKGTRVKGKHKPGQLKPVSKLVFTRPQALSLGQAHVSPTAKRTFKLLPSKGAIGIFKGRKFRQQEFSKKGRVYVEKTKFAIDTPGELSQITGKGLATKRLSVHKKAVRKKKKKTKRR